MSDKKTTEQNKKTKNSKRKYSVIKFFILSVIFISIIGGAIVIGGIYAIIKDAEPIDATNIYTLLDESSFILDANGEIIEKIQSEGVRIIIEFNDMPEVVRNAFVAIEDERFWRHNGIDIRRIFGAAWTNFRTGSRQGASTINQQLAKVIFLSPEQTYTRKILDAYYGMLLNRQLSKEQILEVYLNTINLGSGAFGIQAASQVYFSKDVSELTIAQAALLAGITRNPSRYSPLLTIPKDRVTDEHYVLDDSHPIYTIVYKDSYRGRMQTVLAKMLEHEYITQKEFDEALNEDIKSNLRPNRFFTEEISSYFGDIVRRDVINALESKGYTREEARNLLHSGGLRIYSTMDMRIQRILEEEYDNPANFPGTLKDSEGNLIRDAEGNIQPQSAMVILDHHTGEIRALVGGRMITGQKIFNRALSPRQPGSAIKTLAVFVPAINQGLTAGSIIDDIPVFLNRATPDVPWPSNWYRDRYFGLLTYREALSWSSNVAAVRIATLLGPDERSSILTMLDYLEKMGISTVIRSSDPVVVNNKRFSDETLSTALGGMTRGVTPLDLTTAHGVLANEGVKINPITFTKIYDRHGNLIYENKPQATRVLTPQVSYVITDMLRTAVTSGTGTRAKFERTNNVIPVAGKTGTTSDRIDAWFVGYTPYYTASVWIGNDMPAPLVDGSRIAAELWRVVMARVHEDYSPRDFIRPDDVISVNICTKSGKLPTELCHLDPRGSTVRSEVFIRGTEPREECDVHVLADIHVPSGKLATEHTPTWEIETRVFVRRPIPFFPEEHNGIVPRDFVYELPRHYHDPFADWLDGNKPPQNPLDDDDDEVTEDTIIDSNENGSIINNIIRNINNRLNNNNNDD